MPAPRKQGLLRQPSLLIVAASFMLVSGLREQEGVSKSAQPAVSAQGDAKVQKQIKDANKQIAMRTYDVSDLVSVRALWRSQVPSLWGIEFNNENHDGMAALVRVQGLVGPLRRGVVPHDTHPSASAPHSLPDFSRAGCSQMYAAGGPFQPTPVNVYPKTARSSRPSPLKSPTNRPVS